MYNLLWGKRMAKVLSGRTLGVLLVFDVPPTVAAGQEEALLIPSVTVSLGATSFLRVVTSKVSQDEDPETMAKQFQGPGLKIQ